MRYKGVSIDDISLFNTPRLYTHLSLQLATDLLRSLLSLALTKGLQLLALLFLWLLIGNLTIFETLESVIIFVLYWIVLGVASSIGLGTGLHTFVLYLGPHIAKLALTATICGKVPEMMPSRWRFEHFGECSNPAHEEIGFLGILMSVQLESFLWGLGTAIGQLPPYFVAKKAAETQHQLKMMRFQAQKQLSPEPTPQLCPDQSDVLLPHPETKAKKVPFSELEEIDELRRKQDLTLMERSKLLIFNHLKKYGFWTILVCASIPNPFFDLAGITSGHFRIPFKTFFLATFIGKAIIKVHIQMLFIIAIFRKETLDFLIGLIKQVSSSLAESFSRKLEASKKQLNQASSVREDKSFVGGLWDLFITGMVLYFLKSILDAYVKEKAIELRDG